MTLRGSMATEEPVGKPACSRGPKKIWIDLDNTPHVPFFLPIIEGLEKRGHKVLLTARDSYQVCELVKFHHLDCKVIGSHWGKHRILKMVGTFWRALRLIPLIAKEKPDLAVAHGSRAQIVSCALFGVPCLSIFDYEFTAKTGFLRADWVFVPELIPDSQLSTCKNVMKYPGLKEDVYVSRLKPDSSVKQQLGLDGAGLIVIMRPPATEAHYHNPEAEVLMDAALNFLLGRPDVRVVLLPRNERQEKVLRKAWGGWIANSRIVIPKAVVDGLNLIWFSDLVISGGGTMNREAAALGVPVYSIFRGRIGAIDRYLADAGRLVLLESVDDVRTKIALKPRDQAYQGVQRPSLALDSILEGIVSIAENQCLPAHR